MPTIVLGDAQLIAELTQERAKVAYEQEKSAGLAEKVEIQKTYIESLKKNLQDKDSIIDLYSGILHVVLDLVCF